MFEAWHALEVEEVIKKLNTGTSGLSSEEAERRLKEYGPNEIKEVKRRGALRIFLSEFNDIFVLLLIAATIFSTLVGYWELTHGGEFWEAFGDAVVIGAIVLLCAVSGFIHEYRAEKAIEALKKLTAPKARVIRNGNEILIPASQVVPGDILVLEEGDRIAADARLVEVIELKTDEAILTGESVPVHKEVKVVSEDTPLPERRNMVYSSTHVVHGRGKGVVVATGMNTEFGKIAGLVQTIEKEDTPLKKRLNKLSSKIGKVVIITCAIIFVLEAVEIVLRSQLEVEQFIQAFMSAIALAISAVPEGLPAIVTITLALGAREFAKRNALLRKLATAESLGSVTVICSDKTGTITKGEMTVRRLYVNDKLIEVSGTGYEPRGEFIEDGKKVELGEDVKLLLLAGVLCNNASLRKKENGWEIFGDPTEGALLVSAAKANLWKEEVEKKFVRIGEIPFTSERKRMTTIHRDENGKIWVFMKGATEIVLEKCKSILINGKEVELDEGLRNKVLGINEELARNALRVLGFAYKKMEVYGNDDVEEGLVFIGLQAMIDPPREDAIEAHKKCVKAGIKTVMITGDHKLTALAIAREVGIYKEGDLILTGKELDALSDEELEKIVEKVSVYARVSPEHKLRIVNALKKRGHIVAMTGDGVNDAPAIKRADVGIAMGITGTDVTKEASDLILLDDNFATIQKAVEQGRVIYDNIRKYARYLLACNFDELLVIGSFALLGGIFSPQLFPLPLLPPMILWINLVTDGGPAIALAMDTPDYEVMEKPPRKPTEGILHGMKVFILASFLLQAAGTFLVFSLEYYFFPAHPWLLPNGEIDEVARQLTYREATTAAFLQAALFELFVVWNCRSERRCVWRMGRKIFTNKFLWIAVLISLISTLSLPYIPITQQLFHLAPMNLRDLFIIFFVSSWGLFVFPEIFMNRKLWKWE
ncbi:MAG: cation-translocating P-type ATPase [Candidatus Nanoarchaeia archaeon]|nr:cation-translocating P-type ATPase [Candidatus Haiyanarchaeum thermophilum]MCW1303329.1 cation-translocating P-type ATPase [Candidatus Haiyanarchaeum thermophilum]MCW1304089.1 cation-translocating P-type ATPase [Candidatus Haiyanarchaeum thermophilum]MCW1306488.1 cation-translocating P-type ATPase [Candidatus Haiyanarchaeum thermophilum]MCW1307215.1 cation-translocating P-type ATPase [Candidatus Haiyanarchaeum thermophilum]